MTTSCAEITRFYPCMELPWFYPWWNFLDLSLYGTPSVLSEYGSPLILSVYGTPTILPVMELPQFYPCMELSRFYPSMKLPRFYPSMEIRDFSRVWNSLDVTCVRSYHNLLLICGTCKILVDWVTSTILQECVERSQIYSWGAELPRHYSYLLQYTHHVFTLVPILPLWETLTL